MVGSGRLGAAPFRLERSRRRRRVVRRSRGRVDLSPDPRSARTQAGPVIVILAIAAVVVAVVFEQSQPGTWLAQAAPAPIWRESAALLNVEAAPAAAVAVNAPMLSLGPFLADALALTIAFVLCAERSVADRLLRLTAWCGVAYAAYGAIALAVDPGMVLWREKTQYASVLTSTFLNRNTAALYFGSCSILWLLLACRRLRHDGGGRPMTAARLRELLLVKPSPPLVLNSTMWLLTAAAMFMTGSRGGALISLAAMVLAFLCYFRSEFAGAKRMLAAACAAGAVGFLLLQIMGEGVSARLDLRGVSDEGRLDIYRATLAIIRDHPWFGAGLGTFARVLPAYRPSDISIWGTWDRAHSTPLETISDLGLPTAGLIFLGWLALFIVLAWKGLDHRSDTIFPIAGLCVAVAAVLHSSIDFSLQTPGYSIPAMSLIGMGLARQLRRCGTSVSHLYRGRPLRRRSSSIEQVKTERLDRFDRQGGQKR